LPLFRKDKPHDSWAGARARASAQPRITRRRARRRAFLIRPGKSKGKCSSTEYTKKGTKKSFFSKTGEVLDTGWGEEEIGCCENKKKERMGV
jgi:hypothetical protein